MEPEGVGSGQFAVLSATDNQTTYFWEGSTLKLEAAHTDEFRRAWTGYALLPGREGGFRSVRIILAVVSAICATIYFAKVKWFSGTGGRL
jgi:hypothetical protein